MGSPVWKLCPVSGVKAVRLVSASLLVSGHETPRRQAPLKAQEVGPRAVCRALLCGSFGLKKKEASGATSGLLPFFKLFFGGFGEPLSSQPNKKEADSVFSYGNPLGI